jgi:hypothetical protein
MKGNAMTYGPVTENDSRMFTADGVAIKENGRYFNYYDCFWVVVLFESGTGGPNGEYWDGWFRTKTDDGSPGPLLNGERMSSKPPAWFKD